MNIRSIVAHTMGGAAIGAVRGYNRGEALAHAISREVLPAGEDPRIPFALIEGTMGAAGGLMLGLAQPYLPNALRTSNIIKGIISMTVNKVVSVYDRTITFINYFR